LLYQAIAVQIEPSLLVVSMNSTMLLLILFELREI